MIAVGSKPGIDATKKLPGGGFKRRWPPLIKMDAAVKAKLENKFNWAMHLIPLGRDFVCKSFPTPKSFGVAAIPVHPSRATFATAASWLIDLVVENQPLSG